MKLLSLHAERFAGLTDQKVDFRDGINLFYGENESGKSSLCECLIFLFYGLENKAQRIRFIPWDADSASASAVLEKDGRVYRAERSVSRAGLDSHRIIDTASGEIAFAGQDIWEVFLQIPQVLYRRSAFIGQGDSPKIDGRPMESAIENLLISADETVDTQKAIKRLDDARIPLLYKRKNGGRIFEIQQQIAMLGSQMQSAQKAQSELMQQEHLLSQLQVQLQQNEVDTQAQNDLLAFWEEGKRRTAFLQLSSKEKQADEARDAKEAWDLSHTENGFLPDLVYINTLKAFQLPLREQRADYAELQERCDALEESLRMADVDVSGLEKAKKDGKRRVMRNRFFCVFTILCAFALFGTALLWKAPIVWINYAFFGGAVAFGIATIFLYSAYRKAQFRLHQLYGAWGSGNEASFDQAIAQFHAQIYNQQQKRNEYNALLLQKEEARIALSELEEKVKDALSRWGKSDLDSAIESAEFAFQRHLELTHKAELAESELRGYQVLVPVSEEDIIQFRTTPYDFSRFDTLNGDTIRATLFQLGHAKNDLEQRKQSCELTLAALRATLRSPADLEEDILRLQKEEARLQQMHDALCLASDAICAARDKIRDGLAPHLTERAGNLMAHFTQGRYHHLQISREFAIEYATEKDQRTHNDSYFSAGTADAAYFSLRLALAQVLFPEPLPLILDESFCRIDDHRYRAILQMLSGYCQDGQQVLLFTSQSRDVALASEVLSVEPITMTK